MSDLSHTLELPLVDAPLLEPDDAPTASLDVPAYIEAEPTTATIPIVGAAEAIVVDEPEPGVRSIESLTISARRARFALFTLAFGAFALGANEGAVVALSPVIARGLDVSVASVGLLVTAFAATVVIATMPLTLFTQRLGKRVTLTATLAVWTTGVVVAATAGSLAQLTAGRVVSAAAHALFWALVAPTAASLFAPHLRGQTVTRIMVGASAAGVVGTPLVTVTGTQIGWQVPFWALGAMGLALTVMIGASLPGSKGASGSSTHTVGDVPSGRAYGRVLVVAFLGSVAMSITWTYIVAFYTRQSGVPTSAVPVMFAIGGVVGVAATLAIGKVLSTRVVETVAGGLTLLVIAWGVLAVGHQWTAVAAQVLLSGGWSILVAGLLNWALRHTPWRTDMGAAAYTVTMNLGGAAGPLLGSAIVAMWSTRSLPLVSLALTAVAAVVVVRVDRTMLRRVRVPRRVRSAIAAREHLKEQRREWRRRMGKGVRATRRERPRRREAASRP